MRNASVHDYDHLPVDVLPIGTEYPPEFLLARHEHRRAQLLYGASGVMQVATDDGAWTVPADRAVLIPPGTAHEVRMLGVTTWSLYAEPGVVPWWPRTCTVIDVEPLLRELLRTANGFALDYDPAAREGDVLRLALAEVRRAAPLPLEITLPQTAALRAVCRAYLADPDVAATNDRWAREARMSGRTFERRFSAETGMSPAQWRLRARLLASLPALQQEPVSVVAAALGYATPAGFTAAFTRAFGAPPSRFAARPVRGH